MTDAAPQRMCALLVADRIDIRGLRHGEPSAGDPFVASAGANGRAFVFRDGAVAFFGANDEEQQAFLCTLEGRLRDPLTQPVMEEALLSVREDGDEQVLPDGAIAIRGLDTARLVIVAEVLAKAAALNYCEPIVEAALARAEPLAAELAQLGRTSASLQELGKRMGEALLVEHRLVGRAAVAEKPDLLWDHPQLERLYGRLEAEYELRDRALVLERKLGFLRTASTLITELVQNRRAQLLEWLIIGLIAFEIALSILTLTVFRS